MNSQNHIALVLRFIQAWNERDAEAIMSMLSAEIVYHNIPMAPLRGSSSVRASVQSVCARSSEIHWSALHIAATPDGVVLTERLDNFVMEGRAVSVPVMGAFRCADGLIYEWRDYFDLAQYRNQLTSA